GLRPLACASSTGNDSGMVQAYFLPPWTMTSSSRTRSKVARSIGPVRGLRPPSPRRYSVDRSASLTGSRGSAAARALKSAASAAGTLRSTGSLRPPCGGIKSGIIAPLDLVGKGLTLTAAAQQFGEADALQRPLLLHLDLLPHRQQGADDGCAVGLAQ